MAIKPKGVQISWTKQVTDRVIDFVFDNEYRRRRGLWIGLVEENRKLIPGDGFFFSGQTYCVPGAVDITALHTSLNDKASSILSDIASVDREITKVRQSIAVLLIGLKNTKQDIRDVLPDSFAELFGLQDVIRTRPVAFNLHPEGKRRWAKTEEAINYYMALKLMY